MVSVLLIFSLSSLFFRFMRTVLSAPTTIVITVIFMFHSLFSVLAMSSYLFSFFTGIIVIIIISRTLIHAFSYILCSCVFTPDVCRQSLKSEREKVASIFNKFQPPSSIPVNSHPIFQNFYSASLDWFLMPLWLCPNFYILNLSLLLSKILVFSDFRYLFRMYIENLLYSNKKSPWRSGKHADIVVVTPLRSLWN